MKHSHLRAQRALWERGQKACKNRGVCCEVVSPSNVKSYTHRILSTWLPKCEISKKDTNAHTRLEEEKPCASTPHKKLQATEEVWEKDKWLFHGKAYGLVIQCQMVSPETYR